MDKEKTKKKAPAPAANRPRFSFGEYFRGIKTEMKKVVWPTKKELGAYTAAVFIICTFFAVGFWLLDSGFLLALKGLLGISM